MKIRRKTSKPVRSGKKQAKHTIPPEDRRTNGQFKKGVSGNPAGGPKGGSKRDELRAAIERVETKIGKNWLEHQIKKSFDDVPLAIAILARLQPSLKAIEMLGAMGVGKLPEEEAKAIQEELRKNYVCPK